MIILAEKTQQMLTKTRTKKKSVCWLLLVLEEVRDGAGGRSGAVIIGHGVEDLKLTR